MNLAKIKSLFKGASGDSFFLIAVRLVTLVFGILITRMLSEHFTVYEYGTYSEVILLATTVSSLTILGMMDGINFFFCKEKDEEKRNAYVSTIFFLQYVVSAIAAVTVIACTIPLVAYFGNEKLKSLIVFAALLPVLQNSVSLLQIMFVAIGKARQIALRNLIVSVIKLLAVLVACYVFDNIVIVLVSQVLTELLQVVYFVLVLKKNNCRINVFKFDKGLIREILKYCLPMAMFTVIKSLNKDCDKFVISFFTNTETLAIYTNASKQLPFDIIMVSFCTVLLPYVTRYISEKRYEETKTLYKAFLELSYITTGILAMGAVLAAPELMEFLYTEKYLSGLGVFIIYVVVDMISVLNITLILSAAGKTKTIMFVSFGAFVSNLVLNVLLYRWLGFIGPAVATLVVMLTQGIIILCLGSREIKTNIFNMFDVKRLAIFLIEAVVLGALVYGVRLLIDPLDVHYMVRLVIYFALFAGPLLILNVKPVLKCVSVINGAKKAS